jgi:hypothetical protein
MRNSFDFKQAMINRDTASSYLRKKQAKPQTYTQVGVARTSPKQQIRI